jgi:hypothetical protein
MDSSKIGTMIVDGKMIDLDNEKIEKLAEVERNLKDKENNIKCKINKIIN